MRGEVRGVSIVGDRESVFSQNIVLDVDKHVNISGPYGKERESLSSCSLAALRRSNLLVVEDVAGFPNHGIVGKSSCMSGL